MGALLVITIVGLLYWGYWFSKRKVRQSPTPTHEGKLQQEPSLPEVRRVATKKSKRKRYRRRPNPPSPKKHFRSEAASFKRAGFSAIQWLACGDERTCPTCEAMDRKVLPIEDMRLVVQKHQCENKEDGCRCTFVTPDEDSAPESNVQSKGCEIISNIGFHDIGFGAMLDFNPLLKKAADPGWWREQGRESGDHVMESFGKLIDPNYPLSNEEAKRIIIEIPAIHSAITESNIEINDETVPKILQLIREYLAPEKWGKRAPESLQDAGQEGKT